jgi:IS30 family transposase
VDGVSDDIQGSRGWDRGSELTEHAKFTVATDVKVFFCDPYCPWQRGSNENTNGLLRRYYPKGMDLSAVSQAQLDLVARKLNTQPRGDSGLENSSLFSRIKCFDDPLRPSARVAEIAKRAQEQF